MLREKKKKYINTKCQPLIMTNRDESDGCCKFDDEDLLSLIFNLIEILFCFVLVKKKKQCPFAQALSRLFFSLSNPPSLLLFSPATVDRTTSGNQFRLRYRSTLLPWDFSVFLLPIMILLFVLSHFVVSFRRLLDLRGF